MSYILGFQSWFVCLLLRASGGNGVCIMVGSLVNTVYVMSSENPKKVAGKGLNLVSSSVLAFSDLVLARVVPLLLSGGQAFSKYSINRSNDYFLTDII